MECDICHKETDYENSIIETNFIAERAFIFCKECHERCFNPSKGYFVHEKGFTCDYKHWVRKPYRPKELFVK